MMLQIKNINSYYGESHVLHNVSLEVKNNQVISILGRNGVGKSTILKSIMGIVTPRSGSIKFKNKELVGKAPFRIARNGLGYVPEERRIFPGLTVRENLIMGKKPNGSKKDSDGWSISSVYDLFPVLGKRDKTLAANLSGGEQQILTLSRTLMGNPELILIDEPSEGLSPMMTKLIFDLIDNIHNSGMSVILVDQNLYLTCNTAQKVYVISKGEIVYTGTGKEVLENKDIQASYLAV